MLTTEQIHQVADQIAAAGERPTLSKIRTELGRGSFTTISDAMRSWHEQKKKLDFTLSEVRIPSDVKERIDHAGATLWAAAMHEAERRLEAERDALTKAQERSAAEVTESREVITILEKEAADLNAQVKNVQEELAITEQKWTDSLDRLKQAEHHLSHQTTIAKQLESERNALREQLEKQSESRARAEQKVEFLEKERDQLREQLKVANERGIRAEQQVDDLTAELNRERQRIDTFLGTALRTTDQSQGHDLTESR